MDTTTHSYRDTPGITNRANSAMLRIEQIIGDTRIPSMARLALVAEVMAGEPVLTDGSTAAHVARHEAELWRARGVVA